MKLGNKIYTILILLMTYIDFSIAEEKIVTSPLIKKADGTKCKKGQRLL